MVKLLGFCTNVSRVKIIECIFIFLCILFLYLDILFFFFFRAFSGWIFRLGLFIPPLPFDTRCHVDTNSYFSSVFFPFFLKAKLEFPLMSISNSYSYFHFKFHYTLKTKNTFHQLNPILQKSSQRVFSIHSFHWGQRKYFSITCRLQETPCQSWSCIVLG